MHELYAIKKSFNPQLDLCHKILEDRKSRSRGQILASHLFATYRRVAGVAVVPVDP